MYGYLFAATAASLVEVVFGIRAAGNRENEGVVPDDGLLVGSDGDIVRSAGTGHTVDDALHTFRRRPGGAVDGGRIAFVSSGRREIEGLLIVEHRLPAFVCSRRPGRRQKTEPEQQQDADSRFVRYHDGSFEHGSGKVLQI